VPERNVLLILVDQVIAAALQPYGGACRTPNLARLADEGVVFDNACTTITLCSPARGSLFTGLYPHRHGVLYNTTGAAYGVPDLTRTDTMLTRPLQAAGVRCGYVGKWHAGSRLGPREYGFEGAKCPGFGLPSGHVEEYDAFLREHGRAGMCDAVARHVIAATDVPELRLPFGRHLPPGVKGAEVYAGVLDLPAELTPAGFVASRAIDKLQEFRGCPFFLTASFWGPHHPAFPAPEFAGLHDPLSIPEWPNYRDALEDKPRIQKRYAERLHRRFNREGWPLWRKVIAAHFDHMSMIDAQIGRILAALAELGLSEDTAVVFCADHGDTLGCHGGQWDKGPYMYEETCRVPLIVRGPGVPGERRTGAVVSNMDIYSTVLEVCGASAPPDVDSRSFLPIVEGREGQGRDAVFAHFYGFDTRGLFLQRMVRTERLKYVYNPSDIDELYDLESDPHELTNRVADPEERNALRRLQTRLLAEMTATNDPFVPMAAELMGIEG